MISKTQALADYIQKQTGGITVLVSSDDHVLRNQYTGAVLITGPNGRGGFGFRLPGQANGWHSNFATHVDVDRACAHDGYRQEGEIRR